MKYIKYIKIGINIIISAIWVTYALFVSKLLTYYIRTSNIHPNPSDINMYNGIFKSLPIVLIILYVIKYAFELLVKDSKTSEK